MCVPQLHKVYITLSDRATHFLTARDNSCCACAIHELKAIKIYAIVSCEGNARDYESGLGMNIGDSYFSEYIPSSAFPKKKDKQKNNKGVTLCKRRDTFTVSLHV